MKLALTSTLSICLAIVSLACPAVADDSKTTVSAASQDEHGFLIHAVQSPYQAGETQIRILLPDAIDATAKYPVVYVLPVEAKNEHRYGDGLLEIKRRQLHNKHQAIFVAPTFSHLPWYADHPTDPEIRQETYFLQVVVPFIDKTYPVVAEAKGRYLLGFSKSGWGAWNLLLRHSDTFGKASAWDAPLMMERLGKYGTTGILATQENFEPHRLDKLLRAHAS
ncbi:MAG TPA: alpha/beta hydrolase-fold protein, partial [Pirellulales bacterium]|nr:alpha/beta hydrolase-fold protein [Pirellulales bacterium]